MTLQFLQIATRWFETMKWTKILDETANNLWDIHFNRTNGNIPDANVPDAFLTLFPV